MARAVCPLSNTQIKGLKKREKNYTISDGNGLHLLIKKDGIKLWEFLYTSPTLQKRRKTSFGSYPNTSLKIARELRLEYHNLISSGIDPIDYKNKLKQEIRLKDDANFKLIAEEWLAFEKTKIAPSTYKRKLAMFDNNILPKFAKKNINNITHQDIINIVKLKVKDGIESSNKLYRYLNSVWKYAITKGLCKYNPFNDIDKDLVIPKNIVKHRSKITDNENIEILINKIYNYHGHISTKNALIFVLHTALRPENLLKLKWGYIDFNKRSLTIPRHLMKDKNPNLPDFKLPLNNSAINVLHNQLKFSSSSEYVFSNNINKPLSENTTNKALRTMGFDGIKYKKMTTHGFRGTLRSLSDTYHNQHNTNYEIKEIALDHHSSNSTVRAYNHQADYFEQLKPFVEWWDKYINKFIVTDYRENL